MNIIFISRYQNKIERGVENYVLELSVRLSKKYKVEVLTLTKDLMGKRPDVLYPLNGGFQSFFCRIYSWITGAKLVLGGHAGIGRNDRWNLYMFPDLFIAFSQKGYEWAKKVNPFVKIIKIPHGVNLHKFNPQIKPAKVDLEKPIFITVSHLDRYKRVDLTVKAMAGFKKGSLLVLGEGPEAEKIDELGNELLGKGRYLRTQISHDKMASYLRAADVFTLVSESSEAFGLVYLEAMACGLPIVATNDSLRRELVGGAGILVDNPQDINEYMEALTGTVNKEWESKPVQQAEKFSWDKIVNKYEEYFSHNSGL